MADAVGSRVPNVDAWEKVTGQAQYLSDMTRPGMLWGKVLRSPVAHAVIRHIDTSRARRVPGVELVLTGADCPARKWGPIVADQYILPVDGRVRFVGDEVAAVAAASEEAAEEALSLIEVEYEELPAVFDAEEALQPGAPSVHEGSNLASRIEIERGDLTAGRKQAACTVEGHYSTPIVHQCYIEPVACLAEVGADGRLVMWLPTHMPYNERQILSRALGLPEAQIRVRQTHIGGSFGGKIHHKSYSICALLALRAGRPVKMRDTREEAFQAAYPRVGMRVFGRLGVDRDGRFVAKEMRILADNGAYCDEAPIVLSVAADTMDNLYRLQNVRTEATLVYTNKVPSGAFRGFGNPQTAYAFECLIDEAAAAMGWDPAELRLRNVVGPDCTTVHGWHISSCGIGECIRQATAASGWAQKRLETGSGPVRRGIGLACCVHKSGARRHPVYEGSAALVRVDETGSVTVLCGETEIGQGARTVWAQIAAQVLGVPVPRVHVAPFDTDYSPYGVGTFASRVTTLGGKAVMLAAEDALCQLKAVAADLLGASGERVEPNEVRLGEGSFYLAEQPDNRVGFVETARTAQHRGAGLPVTGKGVFLVPGVVYPDEHDYGNLSTTYSFAAHVAEVEVDIRTGQVRVLQVTAAHDLGRAMNPMAAEGQIEGGVAQGVGYALHEQMVFDDRGCLLNPNFLDYKIVTAVDAPHVRSIFVETMDPAGPFGAKGLGEPALVPVAPAVANAVAHALGRRIRDLPLTPARVWVAMSGPRAGGGEGRD